MGQKGVATSPVGKKELDRQAKEVGWGLLTGL